MLVTDRTDRWRQTLDHYLDELVSESRWRHVLTAASVVVHGSAAVGNADHYSDIDVRLVLPDTEHAAAVGAAITDGLLADGERPVIFRSTRMTADGRRAFFAAELHSLTDTADALHNDLLVELWVMQHASLLADPDDQVGRLVLAASRRFNEARQALAAENLGHAARRQRWLAIAAQRGDTGGVALLGASMVGAVMRLACVLGGRPAPPNKWLLRWTAENTKLGSLAHDDCLRLLGTRTPHEVDVVSARLVEASRVAAGAVWPGAAWVAQPTRYGTATC